MQHRDFAGLRFGRLVVLSRAPRLHSKNKLRRWNCLCDCGAEHVASSISLTRGKTKSCGCLQKPHGHRPVRGGSPTYHSWTAMKERCQNPNAPNFSAYGGAGIGICERWLEFKNFLEDMGDRPSGTSLDRYPNREGNYEPGNCRWATPSQQSRNRKSSRLITFRGETKVMVEWSEKLGWPPGVLKSRIQQGWSPERAITTPWTPKPRK